MQREGSKKADLSTYRGEEVNLELVMNIIVTCSSPSRPSGDSNKSKDGIRERNWEIVGGRFEGKNIKGTVIPGGGDFPVIRPDGITIVDALYRLKTDDGETIIIHNKGLWYEPTKEVPYKFRMIPEFTAPKGKYDWLNKSMFLSVLTKVPDSLSLAKSPGDNDRLIQVYSVN